MIVVVFFLAIRSNVDAANNVVQTNTACTVTRNLVGSVRRIPKVEINARAREQAGGLDHWAIVLEAHKPESSAAGIVMLRKAAKTLRELAAPDTAGEVGFANYANLVAEVYAIEGQQIKPNDPRLHLPDNRCRVCLATMKEPQVLTPVRRQVHEMLQRKGHLRDCSTQPSPL